MKEIQNRIITSIVLLILLYFSIVNKIFLIFTLFTIIFLLFNEFFNIFSRIFKKKNISLMIISFLTLIYLFYFSLYILFFLNSDSLNNKILFIFVLSICISTDLGGFIIGKIFKGKKLISISPNKTYSGMIGSFIFALIVSIIFFKDLDINFNYIFIVLLISSLSQIGDLFISFLKRKARIKDTGTFLPGHGGLLDRLDGILFALPIGLILVSI